MIYSSFDDECRKTHQFVDDWEDGRRQRWWREGRRDLNFEKTRGGPSTVLGCGYDAFPLSHQFRHVDKPDGEKQGGRRGQTPPTLTTYWSLIYIPTEYIYMKMDMTAVTGTGLADSRGCTVVCQDCM